MKCVDLEKLEKAIIYVDRIADGKNPVNNALVEESVLNDPNVIRCMYFIKETLIEIKENGGYIGKRMKKRKMSFPIETLSSFKFDSVKTITRFIQQINDGVDLKIYDKLKYTIVIDWLKKNDYLQETIDVQLGKVTITTEKGNEIGITHSLQTNLSGKQYYRVEYDKTAQEFIVGKLPEIICGAEIEEIEDDTEC